MPQTRSGANYNCFLIRSGGLAKVTLVFLPAPATSACTLDSIFYEHDRDLYRSSIANHEFPRTQTTRRTRQQP